jgi:photosystem II protein
MNTQITFSKNFVERSLPIIRLTKSRNGKTGTATFLFVRPSFFYNEEFLQKEIEEICLKWENKEISSSDLQIKFYEGKPFLLKAIFIFKNANDWFLFLSFIRLYAKETGLSFDSSKIETSLK